MFESYSLRQPPMRYAKIGIFYAMLLPFILGMIFLERSLSLSLDDNRSFILGLAAGCLVGAPIIAFWTGKSSFLKGHLTYYKLVIATLPRATFIQLLFGLFGFALADWYIGNSSGAMMTIWEGLSLSLSIWLILTLPLTLICCYVFKASALKPV